MGRRNRLWLVLAGVLLLGALLSLGCQSDTTGLPRHTIVYGGDLFVARRLNFALHDPAQTSRILGGIAPILRGADIAMLNSEGVVSVGGHFNQLANSTYMFRAHPNLIPHLVDSGLDVMILGNNHMPDYGPESLVEYTDRLRKAGLGYVGAGVDREDARRTVYRKVGDTVVAIVGAELTYAKRYEATENRAGGHYIRAALKNDNWDRRIVRYFRKVAEDARRHAHVVILTPHWDCWDRPPTVCERMRQMGRNLLDAGFDGILAHGKHQTQGVEVHHGKPIIYDAGNSVLDYTPNNEESRGMLWRAEFSRAGIHSIEGIPIYLQTNRTTEAEGGVREKILKRAIDRSEPYGTKLRIEGGHIKLDLNPGGVRGPATAVEPPRREPATEIRLAPNDVIHERLPGGVTKVDVQWESGIKLVGYELIAPSLRAATDSQQVVMLYWQTSQKIADSYVVHLESRPYINGKLGRSRRSANHLPGDWIFPTPMWPIGKVIQDATVFRLNYRPQGEVAFFAGLRKLDSYSASSSRAGKLLTPLSSDVELAGKLVPLGRSPYSEKSEKIRDSYYRWRRERDIELSKEQPWGAPPYEQDAN